jgi:hypothetical protein
VSFTPLPDPPSRNDPTNFNDRADALFEALPIFVQEANTLIPGETAAGLAQFLAGTGAGKGTNLIGTVFDDANAVPRTVQDRTLDAVCVLDFLTIEERADVRSGALSLDVTAGVQKAMNHAWARGRSLFFPAGRYKAKIALPEASPGFDYRGYVFHLFGEGAPNGFLGGSAIRGTVIVSPDSSPALRYDNYVTNSSSCPHIYIEKLRFDATTVNPVVYFNRFSDYSVISKCEIRQHGTGAGIRFDSAYGGLVELTHVMNDQLVAVPPVTRTGTAVDCGTEKTGGLLNLRKITARGFNVGFNLGSGGTGIGALSTMMESCECSTVAYGILVNDGMRKVVIDGCYFEAVENACIVDKGWGTSVRDCFFFGNTAAPLTAIDSTYDTYGNVYRGNYIQLDSANSYGIRLKASSDATGFSKVATENFIYFTGSGGTMAGVRGISLTGTNPAVDLSGNTFRPRRLWVGGANTAKVEYLHTGSMIGCAPLTDALNEYPMLASSNISLADSGSTLTQSNVSGGALTLSPASSKFTVSATSAVSVTSINATDQVPRLVAFFTSNANMTFTKGPFMQLASNFSGPGSLLCELRVIGGTGYLYEFSRTIY